MRLSRAVFPAALLAGLFSATTARAQTGQLVSLQFSGLSAALFGQEFEDINPGFGAEAQIRFTPSAFSIGFGIQYTSHGSDILEDDPSITEDFRLELPGGFIEPRVVFTIRSDVVAPYLSTRLSVLREQGSVTAVDEFGNEFEISVSATGVLGNGGGGLLFALGPRVNLDVGVTVGYGVFGEPSFEINDEPIDLGEAVGTRTGGNVVFRVGLAIGLGS